MPPYADTSFLVSLYIGDANADRARAWLKRSPVPLPFTRLQRNELKNAIRLGSFRRTITSDAAKRALARIDDDLSAGRLLPTPVDWEGVFDRADEIGSAHSEHHGIRSLDLLHLAVSRSLGAKTFLTFDARQHSVARALGFELPLADDR